MNIPGTDTDQIVIGDSDALIALLHEEDSHFAVARSTIEALIRQEARVIFPLTAIVETVTTLQRKLKRPQLAYEVIQKVLNNAIEIEPVDKELLRQATGIFDPKGSKQNTLFDAVVAATAHRRKTKVVFSFDRWYEKRGLTLATQYVQSS